MKIAPLLLLTTGSVSAFAPHNVHSSSTVALNVESSKTNPFAASFAAAAILLSTFGEVPSAVAMNELDFGSNQIISARSGGRAGGRASSGPARAAPRASSRPSVTVNNYSTPRMAAPSVIVTPSIGYGYSPFGYSPFGYSPGLSALGLGVDVMAGISREMREIQEQKEIARTRAELEAAERRQMELEMRIRSMEAQQAAQRGVIPDPQVGAPVAVPQPIIQ